MIDPHLLLDHDEFLRGLARSLVQDAARADDVVQQAYVAALTRPRPVRSLRSWLAGVVRHVAWKSRRSESRRSAHEQQAARGEALPSVADVVAREQARRRVVEAVLRLEEPTRTTMLLRYFDRLPPRAIAQRLGVPAETVRTRIKRALERLRGELDSEYRGERGARTARSEWVAALLPFAKAPPAGALAAAAAATTAAIGTLASGALLMSAKAKLLSAAAVVASGALAWFVLNDDSRIDPTRPALAASDRVSGLPEPAGAERIDAAKEADLDASRAAIEAPPSPAPPIAVDPDFASVVVHATWRRDGAPAAGITLSLYAWSRADHYLFLPEAVTDAAGLARFEKIEPGSILVVGDCGGQTRTKVVAGVVNEVELAIEDGVDIVGEVVDGAGRAVADAAIWLGFDGNQCDHGSVVARSDPGGRFTLKSVTGYRNVGARKHGLAPSPLELVTGTPGTTIRVRLQLAERGGLLRGRVVGPDETPVAGAIVQLGDEQRMLSRPQSMPYELLLRTRSAADGSFEFDGAMTGDQPIVVRSRDLAPWVGRVSIDADVPADLTVRLSRGATLEGKAVNSLGQPAGGAWLTLEGASRLVETEQWSKQDGTFRVDHVMAGTLAARIELEGKSSATKAQLTFADGATTRWDPVIASGLTLRGRVVDGDGRPFLGCYVVVEGPLEGGPGTGGRGDWFVRNAKCDASGGFSFDGCPPAELDVTVHAPGGGLTPAAILQHVHASERELVVTVSDERLCSIWLAGVVIGDDGDPVENADFYAVSRVPTGRSPIFTVEAHTGRLKSGPYAPGDYVVHVRAAGYAEALVAADHVVKDEVRDLGTIRLERGASITVNVRDESGKTPDPLSLEVRRSRSGSWVHAESADGGPFVVERAAPGDYEIVATAPGFVPALRIVTVENGKPVEAELVLRKGVPVTLLATFSPLLLETAAGEGRLATGMLSDERGRPLTRLFFGDLAAAAKEPWRCDLALLPGRHTLELVVDGEAVARATFEVPAKAADGAAADAPIELAFE